ncbi:MAG: Mur ligase domain-containing protein [Candidatus Binatia bacterium]
MAILTQAEFGDLVRCLADDRRATPARQAGRHARVGDRRGAANADALAAQLWQLTGGLRRQVPASIALQALWGDQVGTKLGEDGEKALEAIAEQINACLGEGDTIVEGREVEPDGLLGQYQAKLAEGARREGAPRHVAQGRAGGGRAPARWVARGRLNAPAMPTLRALLPADRVVAVSGSLDVHVERVVTDSRTVGPGDVFVCLPGYRAEGGETRADRHDFIPAALAAGATALVVDRDIAAPPGVTVARVVDAWTTVAEMAAALHGHPSHRLTMVGVTGTSGKTSTERTSSTPCSPPPAIASPASALSTTGSASAPRRPRRPPPTRRRCCRRCCARRSTPAAPP